jgi:hypothetical protein
MLIEQFCALMARIERMLQGIAAGPEDVRPQTSHELLNHVGGRDEAAANRLCTLRSNAQAAGIRPTGWLQQELLAARRYQCGGHLGL